MRGLKKTGAIDALLSDNNPVIHRILAALFLTCSLFITTKLMADQTLPATETTRAFGYVLGDVITQAISLTTGVKLLEELPLTRTGPWLTRRSANISKGKAGQSVLKIEYQIVNSPTSILATGLPVLDLPITDGSSIEVAAWPFSLGPITAENSAVQSSLPAMQPNWSPGAIDTTVNHTAMRYGLLALVTTLLAWLGWWCWRQSNDKVQLPFTHAQHQIRQRGGATADNTAQSWITLHDAINRCAGRTVQLTSLPALIEHRPWLAPFNEQLEEFYNKSSAKFFKQTTLNSNQAETDTNQPTFALYKLIQQLQQAEKRRAR